MKGDLKEGTNIPQQVTGRYINKFFVRPIQNYLDENLPP